MSLESQFLTSFNVRVGILFLATLKRRFGEEKETGDLRESDTVHSKLYLFFHQLSLYFTIPYSLDQQHHQLGYRFL